MLPPEGQPADDIDDDQSFSDGEEPEDDPSSEWPEIHSSILDTIRELGGRVHPKLNWSAPKDATWISATNSMECMTPNDIYLLFKSSDFITHDLEHAFDGCTPDPSLSETETEIPFHLVLRKSVPSVVTSMEFRCFVRRRQIIGICQRELNHYDFLPSLIPTLQELIHDFFEEKLQHTFPDENFVFDVYVPRPKENARVWLIDINPWAPRTDPLLFSWLELLTMADPPLHQDADLEEGVVRLSLRDEDDGSGVIDATEVELELPTYAEFRIVKKNDPEAYSFNSPLYSAHKLPKDVVDASLGGEGGLRDFISRWDTVKEEAEKGMIDSDDE